MTTIVLLFVKMMGLHVIDLFCGCGGFSEGARQAGAVIVLAIDSWQEALNVHKANHPESEHWCLTLGPHATDFTFRLKEFMRGYDRVHIHASPPCQMLSRANRSNRDTIGGLELLQWYMSIVQLVEPYSWTFEQVSCPSIREHLFKCGCSYATIEMKKYGIPNSRVRVFGGSVLWSSLRQGNVTSVQDVFDQLLYTPPDGFD